MPFLYTDNPSATCPNLPAPSNARLQTILPTSPAAYSHNANLVLACPISPDNQQFQTVFSNIETRTIPPREEAFSVHFQYFCGELSGDPSLAQTTHSVSGGGTVNHCNMSVSLVEQSPTRYDRYDTTSMAPLTALATLHAGGWCGRPQIMRRRLVLTSQNKCSGIMQRLWFLPVRQKQRSVIL